MSLDLTQIDFVLVSPSEGGNVGACCRALMNCGFGRLTLVRPEVQNWEEARRFAVHAAGLLDTCRREDSLQSALDGAHWTVGVSGRVRAYPERRPPIGPDELVLRLRALPAGARTALVFGPERTGLTNEELGRCQDILRLPTSPEYPILNLSHAVLAVAWTLWRAEAEPAPVAPARGLADAGALDGLVRHMQHTLSVIGYLNPENPRWILDDLRVLLMRASLDVREVAMLRGIFHCMDVWIVNHGGPPTPNQARPRGGPST